jgi:hypothetical protein
VRRTAERLVAAVVLMVLVLMSTVALDVTSSGADPLQSTTLDPGGTWLDLVNDYRAMAGLAPVVEEPSWSDGLAKHLTYLQQTPASFKTGAYASAHTENPASPWYTPEGADAGRSADLYIGNVPSDRTAIEAWMVAPFHAIGILRSRLQRVAYARTSAGAALDVIRGVTGPASQQPVMWPGAGSQVDLTQAGPESPDPLDSCPGFKRPAGLPILALLLSDPPAGTTAHLHRPDGSTIGEGADLCVITAATFQSSDPTYGAAGKAVLTSDHVVVIIPRSPLTTGEYGVDLIRPGQITLSWSFSAVQDAPTKPSTALAGRYNPMVPLRALDTRAGIGASRRKVGAGEIVHLALGGDIVPTGTAAVTLNVTVTEPDGPGYVTVFPCGSAPPLASNLNYDAGATIANLTTVALDANGAVCLYTMAGAHLIADVDGYYPAGTAFHGTAPVRLLDTRSGVGAPAGAVPPGGVVELSVLGRPELALPGDTSAVALNVTATDADGPGFVTAWPCGEPMPHASNLNVTAGRSVANLVMVKVGAGGKVCLSSMGAVDLVADVQGWFTGEDVYTSVLPERLLDTRVAPAQRVAGGQVVALTVAGTSSVPSAAAATALNVTALDADGPGFVTVWPCGTPRPTASNLNLGPGQAVPNLVVSKVGDGGQVCLFTMTDADLVVDLQGWFRA